MNMQKSDKQISEILKNPEYKFQKIILQYILDKSHSYILLNQNMELSKEDFERFLEIQKKIKKNIPLQYAIGKWNFFGYDFIVNENVLIPRPETEILVEEILKEDFTDKKILDIGTGSGAIAISLGLEAENYEKIYAIDISKNALEIAQENAKKHGVDIKFIQSDLYGNINDGIKFDIIVSNPPYIREDEYENLDNLLYFEPKIALVAGEKGFEIYEKIIVESYKYLNKNGKIFFEIGYEQAKIVSDLLLKNGYNNIKVIKDYNGHDRIVLGELCLNN